MKNCKFLDLFLVNDKISKKLLIFIIDKIIKWKEEIINQIKQHKYYIEKMKIYNNIGREIDDIIFRIYKK